MKVIEVVSGYQAASGPAFSIRGLCRGLTAAGVEVSLHLVAPAPELPPDSGRQFLYPPGKILGRWYSSWPLYRALREGAPRVEIMHNHCLWLLPNVYPPWAVRGTRCRLLSSPRGTLSPQALERSRRFKWLVWHLGQKQVILEAACLHATSTAEYADIRRAGIRVPVAMIPNGVDLPPPAPPNPDPRRPRRLLYLGRIHPIKGLDYLLRAWSKLQEQAPDWELHIVGPDYDGYLSNLQALARELGAERVFFPGPVYGEEKSAAYRQADLFVLPSTTENFGLVVAEALAHGLPAIVTRRAPWPGLVEHDCGWWIELSEGALTEALRQALSLSPLELRSRGERGRAWMAQDYSWTNLGQMMYQTYLWVLGDGPRPPWVETQ